MTISAQLHVSGCMYLSNIELSNCSNFECGPDSVEFRNVTFQFHANMMFNDTPVGNLHFEEPVSVIADICISNRVLANVLVKGYEKNIRVNSNYTQLHVTSVNFDESDSASRSVKLVALNDLFAQGNLEATIDIERE